VPKDHVKMSLWWDAIVYKLAEKVSKREHRPMSYILNRWTATGARAEGHDVPVDVPEDEVVK